MPDPTRLLNTLRRATQAFRDQPGRKGHVVRVADATDVLVAGDLHGNLENFRRLLQQADLVRHPGRHLVLQELIHGPFQYPTGGDKSHQLLDLVAALKCEQPARVHLLIGNHELSQWTGQWIAKADADLNEQFRLGVNVAYSLRGHEVYAAYEELFAALPLAVRTLNRVFLSHSLPTATRLATFDPAILEKKGYAPEDLAPGGSVHALLWGRDTRPETARAFLEKVDADLLVTGHIPCPGGFDVPNDRQVVLDCMGTPASYCLFPTGRPLSHADLVACVRSL